MLLWLHPASFHFFGCRSFCICQILPNIWNIQYLPNIAEHLKYSIFVWTLPNIWIILCFVSQLFILNIEEQSRGIINDQINKYPIANYLADQLEQTNFKMLKMCLCRNLVQPQFNFQEGAFSHYHQNGAQGIWKKNWIWKRNRNLIAIECIRIQSLWVQNLLDSTNTTTSLEKPWHESGKSFDQSWKIFQMYPWNEHTKER